MKPDSDPNSKPKPKPRKLKGRFLHLTDMHPDPFYRTDGSESSACHRKKPKKEKARGGDYGLPFGECDSPMVLTNHTLDFLEKHWAKEVDFVVWTGDSARHDNDRQHPRTPDEIYMLNRDMVSRMEEIFTSRGVPVVPCIGNNDVWPHNIMTAGPNSITNEYSSIWRSFIPFESFQVFQRGGYFSVEVIPDHVAAVSLNTMYFYDSNKAVGGCEYGDRDDPGNLQFDWLEVQLDRYRDRGLQVWLTGHVPPSPGNYFPGCFVRYAEIALRFQDTILGHLFGHMNTDHFFFLNVDDMILPDEEEESDASTPEALKKKKKKKKKDTLAEILMKDFSELPSAKKTDLDEYAVINVSPSVVPNPYLPSFRVFSYNVTGAPVPRKDAKKDLHLAPVKESKRKHGHRHPDKNKNIDCNKKEYRDTWACRPEKPYHASEDAPSRRNQLWTPLGYAQYWMPNVGEANGTVRPRFRLEYLTYALPSLHPPSSGAGEEEPEPEPGLDADHDGKPNSRPEPESINSGKTKKGKTKGFAYPVPLKELPRSLRAPNATRTKSKYALYRMGDLTVGSWVKIGRRVGDKKRKKLRERFARVMYMGGEE
ncbi:endopolyphosphatase [Schizopora paradoxa]|uniref:Endopolyphosphatase n=1 Tax=Schizopora paradoxa TaxID=27342 RepID=A0A0H2S198_9AGAM|nr:endopolyphosphatase [Schizopora paradoxa]